MRFPHWRAALHVCGLRALAFALVIGLLIGISPTVYAQESTPAQADCGPQTGWGMPLGVQMYGQTGAENSLYPFLMESGAHWVRVTFDWRAIEPENTTPDQFAWGSASRATGAAIGTCIKIIGTLDYTAGWAGTAGSRSPIQPEMLDEYVAYVQAVVERFDGDGINDVPSGQVVDFWEFYNEPDFETADGISYGWGLSGAQYAAMLKAVYPAVKAANPRAQVVFGGVAAEWFRDENGLFTRSFLDDVFAAGAGDYFDVMNIHCYPFPANCVKWGSGNTTGLIEKIDAVRAKMNAFGFSKPIILTEVGWHSSSAIEAHPSDDETQARRMVQLLTQGVAADAKVVIYWMLKNPQSPDPNVLGYPYDTGLVTNDPEPVKKPAFTVYRTLVDRLGNAKFLHTVSPATSPTNLEAYRFRDRATNQIFYVTWLNPETTEARYPLVVPGWTATVYDKYGEAVWVIHDVDDGQRDGRVTLYIGREPRYVVME